MKTLLEKMDLTITMTKITMLKEDIRLSKERIEEMLERLAALEAKFLRLQNTES